jgi:hypothetical protein
MADDREFATADKAAAVFLGTPLLAGATMLSLALFFPGTAPYEDRRTIIPVAIGLGFAGAAGSVVYLRWRHRHKQSLILEQRARGGALRLPPRQQTPLMVEISFALANEFLLPPQVCDLSAQPPPITVALIADSVFTAIHDLELEGEMLIDPTGIGTARTFVAQYANTNSRSLQMVTSLADVVSMNRRRTMWRAARERPGGAVPKLAVEPWAIGLALLLSLGVTFGTTIALAQWLDRAHPIQHPNPVFMGIAKFIVRGGFFGLLFVSGLSLILLFPLFFPTFPETCRTIGHLAACIAPPESRDESSPSQTWTKELVWAEVRRIVAKAMRLDELQIRSSTVCA